jgi:hypothetical protein
MIKEKVITEHFNFFKSYATDKINDEQNAVGFIPFKFWKDICCNDGITFKGLKNINPQNLSKHKLNRADLINYVNNCENSFENNGINIYLVYYYSKKNS